MFTRVDLEAARHGALEPRPLSELDTAPMSALDTALMSALDTAPLSELDTVPKSALDTAPMSALASNLHLDGFPISTPEIEIASEALRGAISDIRGAISNVASSDVAHAQRHRLPERELSTLQVRAHDL